MNENIIRPSSLIKVYLFILFKRDPHNHQRFGYAPVLLLLLLLLLIYCTICMVIFQYRLSVHHIYCTQGKKMFFEIFMQSKL